MPAQKGSTCMKPRHHLSPATALTVGLILLVLAALLGILCWQCVSTDLYELYSKPYQNCASRCEYYEKQAEGRFADAQREREQGRDAIAIGYENHAYNWQAMADEARGYLQKHRTGAIALGIGAGFMVLAAAHLIFSGSRSRQRQGTASAAVPAATAETAAPDAEKKAE